MALAVVVWLVLAVAVGIAGKSRGRGGLGWFVLAVFLSPLIAGAILAILPDLRTRELLERMADAGRVDDVALHRAVHGRASRRSGTDRTMAVGAGLLLLLGAIWAAQNFGPSVKDGGPVNASKTVEQAKPDRPAKVVEETSTGAGNGTANDTDAEKAAMIKVMKDAVAARHHGVLPKSMSTEDAEIAAQAAAKWKAKQDGEKTKRELDAMKAKPVPSSGYAEIELAKQAITKMMREPSSAIFDDVFFVNNRKSATGYYVPVVCGTVNGRNGFGGMTGPKHFVAVMSNVAQGVWLEGTTPQNTLATEWNRFCAGQHQ